MPTIKYSDPNYPYPFTAFSFSVEIAVDGVSDNICKASFAECDGLEMTMDVKTIRQGGDNARQIRLTGPVNFGTLTLKRGMTSTFHLWKWFQKMNTQPDLRADAAVVLFSPDDASTTLARFVLTRCVPIKLKAPPLNASSGNIAIEEFQLAYESLRLDDSSDTGGG